MTLPDVMTWRDWLALVQVTGVPARMVSLEGLNPVGATLMRCIGGGEPAFAVEPAELSGVAAGGLGVLWQAARRAPESSPAVRRMPVGVNLNERLMV